MADYLVYKGVAFRQAHEIAGRVVLYCLAKEKTLEEVSLGEYREFSPVIDENVYKAIDINHCVEARKVFGGPAREVVQEAIEKAKKQF